MIAILILIVKTTVNSRRFMINYEKKIYVNRVYVYVTYYLHDF